MADSPLLVKSKAFALEVIKACNEIKQAKHESVLANQFCVQVQVSAQTSEKCSTDTARLILSQNCKLRSKSVRKANIG